jgi:outer membrane biosynthesis protein TonB
MLRDDLDQNNSFILMLYIEIIFRSRVMKHQSKLKLIILTLGVFAFLTSNAMAAKPEWAGQGKEAAKKSEVEQQDKYQQEKQRVEKQKGEQKGELEREQKRLEKQGDDARKEMKKEQKQKKQQSKGAEKQKERKMEQEQKELGKGSEQGQESREQRKKWWRFWE